MAILNHSKSRLLIFERFQKMGTRQQLSGFITVTGDIAVGPNYISTNNFDVVRKVNFVDRLTGKLKSIFNKKPETPTFDVEEFFNELKSKLIIMNKEKATQIVESVKNLMEKAQSNKQTALYEKLKDQETAISKELQLISYGFTTFIDENVLVTYALFDPKPLRLDWIENFTRIIPKDVSDKLTVALSLNVFDNFVVLHYDSDGTGHDLTKEQKKDPILFGVMECSNRLYFIGDWIDEYCDLTLDRIVETMSLTKNDTDLLENNNTLK